MMDLILQTDPGLGEKVNKYGCRFMSLLAIPQLFCQKPLTLEQIQQAYTDMVGVAMDEDCTCNNHEDLICREGFRWLSTAYKCYQIGQIEAGAAFAFWPAAHIYSIIKGQTEHGGVHFRLADMHGKLIYDPRPMTKITRELDVLIYQVR